MTIGTVEKTTISTSVKNRVFTVGVGRKTKQVVYKTYLGSINGKSRWSSQTRHELV